MKDVELFYMNTFFWWVSKLFIGIVSLFFLARGIDVLVHSYTLNNPLEFLMYFFSSSMLILVSAVGVIYCAFRVFRRIKGESVR
ncbi:hypothetical protein ES708_02705 [subsurface metagenome]